MNRSFLTETILSIISLILWCTPSHGATSCIQSKFSGQYESSNQKNDKACITTVAFLPNEQSVATNQTPTQWQDNLIPLITEINQIQEKQSWNLLTEDGSVYAALKRWSALANWQISWEIPVDFPIEIIDSSTGSFDNAVRRVLTALQVSDYPPHPCFYENNVVRVVRRIQGNDDECK